MEIQSKALSGKKPRLSDKQKIINKKKSQKKYYEANKTAIMAQHNLYIQKIDKVKKNKWATEWYYKNKLKVQAKRKQKLASLTAEEKELRRQKQKIYRQKNKLKISQYRKKNYYKNREAIRQSQKNYYSKLHQRDRQSTYKTNLEAKKQKKINKHVLAKTDLNSINFYINNIWNK